jgi:hypothetical protein
MLLPYLISSYLLFMLINDTLKFNVIKCHIHKIFKFIILF